MNGLLTLLALFLCALIVFALPELVAPWGADFGMASIFDAGRAVLISGVLAAIAGYIIYRQPDDGPFLVRVFVSALLIRVFLGTVIFMFRGQEFFGGDALTYDYFGGAQLEAWGGNRYSQSLVKRFAGRGGGSGWGMIYLVAAVYSVIGRNMLAIQFVNAVFGAATAPIIYLCSLRVFNNLRVARFAAIAVAFFPSLVLWSSQGLKDGPIVFFLALSILTTLKLSEKFNLKYIAILVCSLFALLSLRFYIFYMISAAIVGAFVIGMQKLSTTNFIRQFAIIITVGLALTYLGVSRYTSLQIEEFGNLQRVQRSRLDSARTGQSGFGREVDVSTGGGALATIPMGLLYLLFGPFPWQLASLRQSITLPEMIVWWASFPLLILGLWYSIRYRLRQISPILIFTVMLSLAYSVSQGNVGNAYRQRSQLLVFYFIFVAVGYVLLWEGREEKKRRELASQETLSAGIAASPLTRR